MKADFCGYATKAGLKCSDGRTIMAHAFQKQDQQKVPLVWQHGHSDVENVLGHVMLENREDGVYAYAFFNKSAKAAHAAGLVEHKDITMMSIWANQLVERSGNVLHGVIREVSLVLSGANPGALIESVTIQHNDGELVESEDEGIIYTGLEFEHSDIEINTEDGVKVVTHDDDKETNDDAEEAAEDDTGEPDEEVTHAATDKDEDEDGETIQEIFESMTDKQKDVLYHMIGEITEKQANDAKVKHDTKDEDEDKIANHGNTDTNNLEGTEMTNVFEKTGGKEDKATLSHDDLELIVKQAKRGGSLKDAMDDYALEHGITDIDQLFPDAVTIDSMPELMKRRTEWVASVITGVRKSPISRIKTIMADITMEEARAKGYIKGTLKKEEFFSVSKRTTVPTTIYKKQKLDRDDVVDITDLDVVAFLKGEMRIMLDEEIARAILIGDGRDVSDEDKVNEMCIRPIASDHELFTTRVYVNIDDTNSSFQEVIDQVVRNRKHLRGSGRPNMYMSETYISMALLLKDGDGRRMYKNLEEFAAELRVAQIIPVEVMEEDESIVAIIVNPADYVMGADRGGQVSMFDDFDIDYNQYKYLIETRFSGALTKWKSAMVIVRTDGGDVLVSPVEPTFNPVTGALTIPTVTGVEYTNEAGTVLTNVGSPYTVASGESYLVNAAPTTGYYFSTSEDDSWIYTAD